MRTCKVTLCVPAILPSAPQRALPTYCGSDAIKARMKVSAVFGAFGWIYGPPAFAEQASA